LERLLFLRNFLKFKNFFLGKWKVKNILVKWLVKSIIFFSEMESMKNQKIKKSNFFSAELKNFGEMESMKNRKIKKSKFFSVELKIFL
jgi:hypothetical protein